MGSPLSSTTLDAAGVFSGSTRLILIYRTNSGEPYDIVDLNLDNGVLQQTTGSAGRPSAKAFVPLNGKLYMASGDSGYLTEYDPAAGSSRVIGAIPGGRDYYTADVMSDGKIYFGTYAGDGGGLVEYDPATDTQTYLGKADAAFTDAQYSYSIGCDPAGGYVYVALGQSPWYLAVYDLANGTVSTQFKGTDTGGVVQVDASTGEVYYQRTEDGGASSWYALGSGSATLLSGKPVGVTFEPWDNRNGFDTGKARWEPDFGYEVDLGQTPVSSVNDGIVRWRPSGGTWSEATISRDSLSLNPVTLKRMYSVDGSLLILSDFYGPVFSYTPGGSVSIHGWPQYSLYDAVSDGNDTYLSGYTAITLRWDRTQPWTLTTTNDANQPGVNPRDVLGVHKYHYYSCIASNGEFYTAVNHLRDSVGGELGWYNPSDESTGSERTTFERWTPRGIAAIGGTIVYSGNSLDGEDGKLFVFDPLTKTVVSTITPLPGSSNTSAGYIVPLNSADVIGITGSTAYRANITTGQVAWTLDLPAAAFSFSIYPWRDGRADIAPDGYIYFYCEGAFYKLSQQGILTHVAIDAVGGNVVWHGSVGYIYGTSTLRRLV